MTESLFIQNARIIDPGQGIDRTGSLLVERGQVAWIGQGAPPSREYAIIDAQGMIVCPSFVDLHCHLRQPGYENKETIATGSLAAAHGGFTAICCMPNTNPSIDSAESISYVKSIAVREAAVRVLPIGCVTKGRQGKELADLAAMAEAGAVAFSDDGSPVSTSLLMRQALETGKRLGLPIIDHCEDVSLAAGGHINEGEVSAKLGVKGIPNAAEDIIVARDIALAELTGAHLHIAHVSTAGSVEFIRRAKEKAIDVTAEVTPNHLTLTDEMAISHGTSAKVNPPLRTRQDVQALVQGLKDGVIDIIATDHAPHAAADKPADFSRSAFGISVFETALGSLMTLVHSGQITLPELIARLTTGPAKIIGSKFGKLGTLQVGSPADITIFDPDKEWTVDPSRFVSKGKNTPLAGAKLKGKVMATIVQGKLVYHEDSLKIREKVKG